MSLNEPHSHIILPRLYVDHVVLLHGIAWLSSSGIFQRCFYVPFVWHMFIGAIFLLKVRITTRAPPTMKWQRQVRPPEHCLNALDDKDPSLLVKQMTQEWKNGGEEHRKKLDECMNETLKARMNAGNKMKQEGKQGMNEPRINERTNQWLNEQTYESNTPGTTELMNQWMPKSVVNQKHIQYVLPNEASAQWCNGIWTKYFNPYDNLWLGTVTSIISIVGNVWLQACQGSKHFIFDFSIQFDYWALQLRICSEYQNIKISKYQNIKNRFPNSIPIGYLWLDTLVQWDIKTLKHTPETGDCTVCMFRIKHAVLDTII